MKNDISNYSHQNSAIAYTTPTLAIRCIFVYVYYRLW